MTSKISDAGDAIADSSATPTIDLLTAKEAAKLLKVSLSWLAKARKRGDGPPYSKLRRTIRYSEADLLEWLKRHKR
jgi:excisionase family DNA binding protein